MATGVDAKLLKSTKFPPEFNQKVDMQKVNLQLTGFLDKDTAPFCKELWKLFLSAQTSPQGVPKELLEAKKLELIQEKMEADRAADEARRRRGDIDRRQQDGPAPRDRDRGERGRDTEDGSAATGRAHRLRGTVIKGTEAHSVGLLETAMSQGIAVLVAEYLAAVATTRALSLRHPPPHDRAALIASETRAVGHLRPPPDELVENAANLPPGPREIDRCRREGARVIIANHEGKGDLHEALQRPQHRLINGRLQSAADTPHHGVVHQAVRDDLAVEARTQPHLEVLDPAAVALRVEPLEDVQVRDLEAVPDIATGVASLALQTPTAAEERPMT
ncbi:hypothetical protein CFIO01_01436 [Colletotrichum fioriniae PJ7]|uniref:PWI domain-containing protein n=1 Tax=Colletotrichum fioriniae PJ7 TaxID=1445577 RepID=A0A010R386_9PEZI|nr:hypothetical protein CFIO01_01436 [Colletotrichum fioriniae PJ7]